MPKFIDRYGRPDETNEEVVRALLYPDRAQYDELGRTPSPEAQDELSGRSGPREQGAAPLDLDQVDE